jgi:energy-coupling factor transporter ATP-binding protein EcfA2
MEKIFVRYFGPINELEIDIKEINIFIGTPSSGKSTIAKLISIFKGPALKRNISYNNFHSLLHEYNIAFEITDNTFIRYENGSFFFELKGQSLNNNYPYKDVAAGLELSLNIPIYGNGNFDSLSYKLSKYLNFTSSINFNLLFDEIKQSTDQLEISKANTVKAILDDISKIKGNIVHSPEQTSTQQFFKRFDELISILAEEINLFDPIYVPAERMFFSSVSDSIFGLMRSNISLPKCIFDFGARFEQARKTIKTFTLPFLDAEYIYDDKYDYIRLNNNSNIKLSEASSGLQSTVPLLLVTNFYTSVDNILKNQFVIEEPELNLYPSSQKELIEFIIKSINASTDNLTITTHSPYMLTSIDNLILAHNIAIDKPSLRGKVEDIISSEYWIDFKRISCYYFENGSCKSTLDEENKSIGPSNIDDVSIKISETYERLLELKYA